MLTLIAKTRKIIGKKTKGLRQKGLLPAVLYGPKTKSQPIEVNIKDFENAYRNAGESSLISLEVEGRKHLVLIHDLAKDPVSGLPMHVDFYQPDLEKKIEAQVPILLEGEAPAVKTLGGTLYKNISEIHVKALPQNLPKEIRVDISGLSTFEDHIKVRDLAVSEGVEILREPEEIVVSISAPEKVEEELEKPIEEKVEEVEKVKKEKKEEIAEEQE
ncbi:MAG: 50S ribosomal protein L25 [Candidatus Nealsonbacteria bacterium]|nr:50S ribosomal protein L25 [Candidatus Nealsonbacteria bacterium]